MGKEKITYCEGYQDRDVFVSCASSKDYLSNPYNLFKHENKTYCGNCLLKVTIPPNVRQSSNLIKLYKED